MFIHILATGSALPDHEVSNAFFEQRLDTTDEWIISRTGIHSRRLSAGQTTTDLAAAAAAQALANSKLTPDDIDLVICATMTPDTRAPSVACRVRDALGIKRAVAFDLNAACTGFIYALSVARGLMETGAYHNALIIGAETLSTITDFEDRSTCILFADGAGAALLGQTAEDGLPFGRGRLLADCLESVPDTDGVLVCGYPVADTPFMSTDNEPHHVVMNGKRVFSFAVGAMMEAIETVMNQASLPISSLRRIVPHQANTRIISSVAARMGIDPELFYVNLQTRGNTSSASIPIALHELAEAGGLARGDLVLLVGFGAGLTTGAVLIEW